MIISRRRGIAAVVISFLILFELFVMPIQHTEGKELMTLYFHPYSEETSILGGYLDQNIPSSKNTTSCYMGSFEIEDVYSIDGNVTYDLYFSAPPVDIASLYAFISSDEIASNLSLNNGLSSFIENITIAGLKAGFISNTTASNITRLTKNISAYPTELIENLTGGFFEFAKNFVKVREDMKLSLTNDTEEITNKTITVTRDLFNISSPRIQRKIGTLGDIHHNASNENIYINIEPMEEEYLLIDVGNVIASQSNISSSLMKSLGRFGFLYGSKDKPSRIILSGISTGEMSKYGLKRYYLHDDTEIIGGNSVKTMDKNQKISNNTKRIYISRDGVTWYTTPFENAVRIYGDVKTNLYLNLSGISGVIGYNINATLLDINETGNQIEIKSNTTRVRYIPIPFIKEEQPASITIEDVDYTIEHNHSMGISISLNSSILMGLLKKPEILYDSTNFSSNIEIPFAPLDDIKLLLKTPADQHILKLANATYNITIENKGPQNVVNITISVLDPTYLAENNQWQVWINGAEGRQLSLIVPTKEELPLNISIRPPDNTTYGNNVTVLIIANSSRGYDQIQGSIAVSKENRKYGLEIIGPENKSKEVRIGSSFTYPFKIKNTGNDIDNFVVEASSEHNWSISIDKSYIESLSPGEEKSFNITITVPKSASENTDDQLNVTIYPESDRSKIVETSLITKAVSPSLSQIIMENFNAAAKGIWMDKILGESAGIALLFIVVVLVFMFLVFMAYIITRKFTEIICLERVKEVEPGGKTKFDVTIRNPSNQRLTYDVIINRDSLPEGWYMEISDKEFKLDPGQEKNISLDLTTTTDVDPEGYAEIKLEVIPREKPKISSITLLAVAKGAKTNLKISNVFHWPRTFKEGDTITTKLTLRNNGNVKAKNVVVTLSVNGIEKNKVDSIAIPPKGYAEIKIPWVASSGENIVHISVREQ